MNEILSQQELDALLSSVKETVTGQTKKIKRYDFKHPDKFSKDHMRTLQMLHENLARLWSSSLSAHLRARSTSNLSLLNRQVMRSLSATSPIPHSWPPSLWIPFRDT